MVPITPNASFTETTVPLIWNDLSDSTFPAPTCCTSDTDNATGILWSFTGLASGASQTFSFNTVIVDTVPAGGFSFSGAAGSPVGGTVATIIDPNTSATSSAYSATINWGDGTTSPGTISGSNGSFSATGNHAYTAGGTYPWQPRSHPSAQPGELDRDRLGDDHRSAGDGPHRRAVGHRHRRGVFGLGESERTSDDGIFPVRPGPEVLGRRACGVHQLDAGANRRLRLREPHRDGVGRGSVPNALYHVRLVATNSAGTTVGPDVTFTTAKAPAPGSPALGKTVNISLVSGLVLVKIHGVFVPLTELTQIPTNTEINALKGSIKLITAINGGTHPASDAAAKGKKPKPKPKPKTQSGTFGGAIFKITQARSGAGKGLATLAIVEGAFKGAPSYSLCTKHKAADPSATAASVKTLQLLHASAKGKFRTKGKYSAATVLGTKWTVADRCDGTLTHDITDSVSVTDFVHHKTITLHAGQSYLAKKP